jgi:hypothetical protein
MDSKDAALGITVRKSNIAFTLGNTSQVTVEKDRSDKLQKSDEPKLTDSGVFTIKLVVISSSRNDFQARDPTV